ncbi:MAG: flagellar hook-basal body complex protein FliE [Planctomycetota bacterium]|nr:flagellar hook-basal body complex protein FliE [Planctomycetota bacterium]
MKPIAGIQPPLRPPSPFGDRGMSTSQTQAASGADNFGDLLTSQVKNVNSMQMDANDMVHSMLTGGDVNEAEVLTAVQKADLAFRMLLQVRNKLIEAYREIQQIQI